MSRFTFEKNVVVITGASAGIGRELAFKLAENGAYLVLAARNLKKLQEVVKICRKLGGKAIAVKTHVSEKMQCKRLIGKAVRQFKRIDILINNAGLTMSAMFADIKKIEILEKVMKVNYFGSMYCTHFALPYLKKSKGRIVGVSSYTGKTGVPTRTGYAASKHAMAGFFDSLRIELKKTGISVSMIYPGFVATGMRERALDKNGKPMKKSHIDESLAMSVEECSEMILEAVAKRKRELVMTAKGKFGLWMKLIAPALVDRTATKSIETGRT